MTELLAGALSDAEDPRGLLEALERGRAAGQNIEQRKDSRRDLMVDRNS